MMPTKLVPAAVAMLADALTQPLNLSNQFFVCHLIKIFVHKLLRVTS